MNDLHLWQQMRCTIPDPDEVVPLLEKRSFLGKRYRSPGSLGILGRSVKTGTPISFNEVCHDKAEKTAFVWDFGRPRGRSLFCVSDECAQAQYQWRELRKNQTGYDPGRGGSNLGWIGRRLYDQAYYQRM